MVALNNFSKRYRISTGSEAPPEIQKRTPERFGGLVVARSTNQASADSPSASCNQTVFHNFPSSLNLTAI